jgi:FkbM family methyltransferase
MEKKISFLIVTLISVFNFLFYFFFKKNFLVWISYFIEKKSYSSVKLDGGFLKFFTPNFITYWRYKTFFEKEPETLTWISGFPKNKKFIFWDVGANIGLYSLYAQKKFPKSTIISFEPSTSNLRILSRNIFINNLDKKIKILPLALNNSNFAFSNLNEGDFIEGGALNVFDNEKNYEGKIFKAKNKYQIMGVSGDNLIKLKILKIPNYIKIDVDGNEHIILEGMKKILLSKNCKGVSIEINDRYKVQKKKVIEILRKKGFKFQHKKQSELISKSDVFKDSYNYVFLKKTIVLL